MTESWDTLHEGRELPSQRLPCGLMSLIRYAAASGDFNPAHLDAESAESREFGRLIVPGRYKQAHLGRMVTEWLGTNGRLVRLSCRYVAADTVGEVLTCKGEIRQRRLEEGRRLIDLSLWMENARGLRTTRGSATAEWTGP